MINQKIYCKIINKAIQTDAIVTLDDYIDKRKKLSMELGPFHGEIISSDEDTQTLLICAQLNNAVYYFNNIEDFHNWLITQNNSTVIFADKVFNQLDTYQKYLQNQLNFNYFKRGQYSGDCKKYIIGSRSMITMYDDDKIFNLYDLNTYLPSINCQQLITDYSPLIYESTVDVENIKSEVDMQQYQKDIDYIIDCCIKYSEKYNKSPYSMIRDYLNSDEFKPQKKTKEVKYPITLKKHSGWTQINGEYQPIIEDLNEKEKQQIKEQLKIERKNNKKSKSNKSVFKSYTLEDLNKLRDEEIKKQSEEENKHITKMKNDLQYALNEEHQKFIKFYNEKYDEIKNYNHKLESAYMCEIEKDQIYSFFGNISDESLLYIKNYSDVIVIIINYLPDSDLNFEFKEIKDVLIFNEPDLDRPKLCAIFKLDNLIYGLKINQSLRAYHYNFNDNLLYIRKPISTQSGQCEIVVNYQLEVK